jgi:hypothetical protein
VLISYASADRERVNKLDRWLRDHGLRVVEIVSFLLLSHNKREHRARRGRIRQNSCSVLANSRDRDWPRLERELAEQVEPRLGAPVLVYLCLDDVALPSHDSMRFASRAPGKTLKGVGEEMLYAVAGVPLPQWQYAHENERL